MSLTLPSLPFALDALEAHISKRTLAEHHGQHYAGYIEKANALASGKGLESATLEDLVRTSAGKHQALFNAAAQAWNHEFFLKCARGAMVPLIEEGFGSYKAFAEKFAETAADLFGSGWVWLVLHGTHLGIEATSNAETPLVTAVVPVLTLDVWGHSSRAATFRPARKGGPSRR